MSSSTRSRPDRGVARLTVLILVVCAVQSLAGAGAAAAPTGAPVPLPDVAVFPASGPQVSMVVNIGGDAKPVRPEAVSVTVNDARQRTTVVPVISDRLAAGLIVDASEPGRKELPGWLSGATRFVLELPPAARAAVVTDSSPPAVVSGLQQGPVDQVRALSAVQPRGARRTSEALTLAVRQLPATPDGPRVLLLYTSAPDAGGEPADRLATRLLNAHTVLVVVSTATNPAYWSAVTRATGGFVAPAGATAVNSALDQVGTLLRARYLVGFPTPAELPVKAAVRVDAGEVTLTADPVVPKSGAAGGEPARSGSGLWVKVVLAVIVVGALTLLIGAALRPR
jgi:hypothetical protein